MSDDDLSFAYPFKITKAIEKRIPISTEILWEISYPSNRFQQISF